jgi:acyl-lipid omega-6 desaturase (Delta-12 desaturase)
MYFANNLFHLIIRKYFMTENSITGKDNQLSWMQIISRYNFPDPIKSWWQIINSVVPYIVIWYLMYLSLNISYWLTLFLSVIAAGFMTRIFIIFHDCGHGSFFKSKRYNTIVGIITGLMVFTPYHKWHHEHHIHHNTVGNLDSRGVGDVLTLTVDEYMSLSKWERFKYRFYRNPGFLFGLAPMLSFLIGNRLTKKYMNFVQRMYVHLTSLGVIAITVLLILAMGWKAYLLIQIPVLLIASTEGIWLFYIQHQYEDVSWVHSDKWDYHDQALLGSSFYKLPGILRWFTGNIGFHHIHHLSPRIPNYKLPKCHYQNPSLQNVIKITLFSGFKALKLRLWSEEAHKMVSFKEAFNTRRLIPHRA